MRLWPSSGRLPCSEWAGLAGLHLEDQQLPKRCGHLSGKTLVSQEEMVSKLKAAVAAARPRLRDHRAGPMPAPAKVSNAAVKRARAYVEAGADMIFPEALETPDEFGRFAQAVDAPLIANMTEFGKSPLLSSARVGQTRLRGRPVSRDGAPAWR